MWHPRGFPLDRGRGLLGKSAPSLRAPGAPQGQAPARPHATSPWPPRACQRSRAGRLCRRPGGAPRELQHHVPRQVTPTWLGPPKHTSSPRQDGAEVRPSCWPEPSAACGLRGAVLRDRTAAPAPSQARGTGGQQPCEPREVAAGNRQVFVGTSGALPPGGRALGGMGAEGRGQAGCVQCPELRCRPD